MLHNNKQYSSSIKTKQYEIREEVFFLVFVFVVFFLGGGGGGGQW